MKSVFVILFFLLLATSFAQKKRCESYIDLSNKIYAENPDSSLVYSKKALDCAVEEHDSLSMAIAKYQFAKYYILKTDLKLAEEYLNEAFAIYSQLNYKLGIAKVYSSKAIIQERIHNPKEALMLSESAIAIYSELPPKDGLATALQNIVNDYIEFRDTVKLNKTFKKLDELYPTFDNSSKYYYFQNKGIYAEFLKNYKLADSLYNIAYTLSIKEKMIDSQATITMYLGRNYRLMNKLKESEVILKQSEIICKENKLNHELVETYTELVETYKFMGKYQSALFYNETLNEINNQLINLEKVNEIASLEKKLLETQKEKEINIEKTKTNEALSTNKKLLLTVLLIASLLVLSVYLFIRTRKLKNKIHEKSLMIEEKQKEILDSISYAKKIQYALLAHKSLIDANLKNSFFLFKPKDIVSGDFYWATSSINKKNEECFYLACCDSTGHGVPGAFMSLLSIGFLSEAIKEKYIEKPNEVFNYVRKRLINSIASEGQKDGFDGILLCINKVTKEVSYAAANNKPILIENGNLKEFPADKMPVGFGIKEAPFSLYTIHYQEGSTLYLYTDGFADQFGGPKGKKFKYKQLNNLLLEISTKPFAQQSTILNRTLTDWQGKLEQVDDVCVIGLAL